MITWDATWGPRYGVLPGYGIQMQNGFHDTFTGAAMGALEIGALPYAKGLLDHHFSNFVRDDGLINYRAQEVAESARMLTILALYYSYTGDKELLLSHFEKAKAIALWLCARRSVALNFEEGDPRSGIVQGYDEGDNFHFKMLHTANDSHFYSSSAEAYRGFVEIGEVWSV